MIFLQKWEVNLIALLINNNAQIRESYKDNSLTLPYFFKFFKKGICNAI